MKQPNKDAGHKISPQQFLWHYSSYEDEMNEFIVFTAMCEKLCLPNRAHDTWR